MERHKSDFPAQIHDYFFGVRETVLSKEQMEEEKETLFAHGSGRNSDEAYQGHGYTDMHARHSYITAHMFYEDLRDIQDSLPPKDIYEQLMTKDDADEILIDSWEDIDQLKKSELLE